MEILVTGCAGFIGSHLTKKLLQDGHQVIGVDSLSDYYDVSLKKDRLKQLVHPQFIFVQNDVSNEQQMKKLFEDHAFDRVIHLAAQAGVRYSIDHPESYIQANILGYFTLLECCRHHHIAHFLYASSSSVYGGNKHYPFSEEDHVDHPMSLYAATKKSNELFAHSYSSLYKLPTTGLRFFTVYGPWGRPDMALFKFAKNILNNQSIDVYNYGEMLRDFTYVEDIVEGITRLMDQIPQENEAWYEEGCHTSESFAPYRVVNIGRNQPVKLLDFIETLEKELGKKAEKNFMPLQKGDVPNTFSNTENLQKLVGFIPETSIEEGIHQFVQWYKEYYQIEEALYEQH
ncbi:NAD-dependent epimerase [Kurthia senegalensis]|uniref:NAD-dependent epimerase n=1 Tax=Kurthia senegalensis TaxID=1033740 RepID=UPI0002897D1F|nr:NAD-dependent epimerase [Kurthia senegalensis]